MTKVQGWQTQCCICHFFVQMRVFLTDDRWKSFLKEKKMSAKECAAEIIDAIATNAPEANVGMVKLLRLVYSISPALAQRIMIRF